VIVATGPYQSPYIPSFARELDSSILQLHSSSYCNSSQIPVESVLVVGAANSGAEIALDLVKTGKHVWLAGRDVGKLPVNSPIGKIFGGRLFWFLARRVLTAGTPIGRKIKERMIGHGGPLGRARRETIAQAGIELVPRVRGVRSGKPQLEDDRVLPVEAVIWATGFHPDFHWIDLPILDEIGYPRHVRGIVPEAPGLYFVGLLFQRALSSALLGGVGIDAAYIVKQLRHNQ
jgi:putative flavoprotein involved in K+ transport